MTISFEDFLSKKINAAYIDPSGDMYWNVADLWYRISPIGDCCSNSWFEHCDNGDALQDAILNKFEKYGGDEPPDLNGYEYIQVDMLKFKTSKGYCTIEFRNGSNGYYSGWARIDLLTAPPNTSDFKVVGDF